MNESRYKFIYSNWVDVNGTKVPLANGLHPVTVNWMRNSVTPEMSADNTYSRIYELENNYKSPDSGVIFRHSNIFYYFKKCYGMENMISEADIKDDDSVYFLLLELDGSNVDYLVGYKFVQDGQTYDYEFKDTVSPSLFDLIKQGKVKILVGCTTEPSYGKDTVQRTGEYFESIGIDSSNVNFLQGNAVLNYTGKVKQFTSHASLEQQVIIAHKYPIDRSSLGYLCDYVRETDLNRQLIRPKKFMSWNRTMNRAHRLAIAHLALKYNLLETGIFSFLHGISHDAIPQLKSLIDESWEECRVIADKITAMVPYEIDTQSLTVEGKQSFQTNENNKKELYADAYLHITSETQFDDYSSPFLSEKTFRPILNLQPFIYVGNFNALKELHRLGFKTFDGYIDESYDSEPDPKKRFAIIEKEVARFANMSINELHNWYYSLQDILLYNQHHFMNLIGYDPLKDFFEAF